MSSKGIFTSGTLKLKPHSCGKVPRDVLSVAINPPQEYNKSYGALELEIFGSKTVTTCVHVAFVWGLWVGELVRVGDRVWVCAGEGLGRGSVALRGLSVNVNKRPMR